MAYRLSNVAIRSFVAQHRIVTESAKASVPSVVGYIVGDEFRGSWWALPDSPAIYQALRRLADDASLLRCRLVEGKVTYVDQDVWIALAALEKSLPAGALDRIVESHMPTGAHVTHREPVALWLPADARIAAALLDAASAEQQLEERIPGITGWLRTPVLRRQ
jgi:hypothetical protein